MAEITAEQIEQHLNVGVAWCTEEQFEGLCRLASQALRQQEGMVLVPREPTDSMLDAGNAARHPSADNVRNHGATTALRVWNAMLARGERDQRGADSQNQITEQVTTQDRDSVVTQSAPHPSTDLLRGIALGLEAAARYCNDENMPILAAILRTLNPADIAAKNPTEQPTGADWKAARERVIRRYSDARCVPVLHKVDYEVKAWTTYWDYSVLGSGPTEDAAWIDAAGRV